MIPGAWTVFASPLGPLTLVAGGAGLAGLLFPGREAGLDERQRGEEPFAAALEQLGEYFAGKRREFSLALELGGTAFQRDVWAGLRQIPYGATVSYSELARAIGRPDRARAVGAAVGRTPVPIVVPCHRVVGADGSLTGYGGGLERKRALLEFEAGPRDQTTLDLYAASSS